MQVTEQQWGWILERHQQFFGKGKRSNFHIKSSSEYRIYPKSRVKCDLYTQKFFTDISLYHGYVYVI